MVFNLLNKGGKNTEICCAYRQQCSHPVHARKKHTLLLIVCMCLWTSRNILDRFLILFPILFLWLSMPGHQGTCIYAFHHSSIFLLSNCNILCVIVIYRWLGNFSLSNCFANSPYSFMHAWIYNCNYNNSVLTFLHKLGVEKEAIIKLLRRQYPMIMELNRENI
jgi:hypothetical protein